MVHVDLEAMKKYWYNVGYRDIQWSDEEYQKLKSLDNYQREQVLEANKKGINDRFNFPVL
jgi:hypothetical protein